MAMSEDERRKIYAELDELLGDWEENEAHEEFLASRLDDDARTVEAHFADRNFEFTTPKKNIVDNIPTWFTAKVAGKVVYFRFRGDNASLRIGEFREDIALEEREKDASRVQKRLSESNALLMVSEDEKERAEIRKRIVWDEIRLGEIVVGPHIDDNHPNHVEHTVVREQVTANPLSSTLSKGQAAELIIEMLDEALTAVGR